MDKKNQRILLIDDDPQVLGLSELVLSKCGYNVISHSNSSHALELFRDVPDQFDLIITDFNMPGKNGADLTREIRQLKPHLPIIICSGSGSDVDEKAIMSCGATLFIRKPFLKDDFLKKVSETISGGLDGCQGSGNAVTIENNFKVSDDTLRCTTKCHKEFSCLSQEKRDFCQIESCIHEEVHFIKKKDNAPCRYRKAFGSTYYCNCPTRKEIYNKYYK